MLEKLSVFGVRAMWSPFLLGFIIIMAVIYLWMVNKPFFKDAENPSTKQQLLFLIALITMYIVAGSPIDLLGHLNFSVHMVQMSVLYLIVPPLFIIGLPKWVFTKLFSYQNVKKVFIFLTKPVFSIFLFNGLFSFYHFPVIFDQVKTDPILHTIVTIALFICSLLMWWPLLCPIKEYRKLSGLQKLAYIFAMGVLLTPACALIIFAEEPLFKTYTDPFVWAKALELCVPTSMLATVDLSSPQLFSWLAPGDDQRLGGVIMKIIQEIVYGIALGFAFFEWVKEEKEKEQQQESALLAILPPLLK